MRDRETSPDVGANIVIAPLKVASAASVDWTAAADVLVVGFGGAGACVAIEAADAGLNVLIVDRFSGGGATALSGGIHYAGETNIQAQAGIEDSVEAMFAYLKLEIGDAVSDATLLSFCKESASNIKWLQSLGVEFGGNPYLSKTVYPPDGHFLYYSGNEPLPAYAAAARPAVRGHRVIGNGYTGHIYFDALRKALEQRNVPVMRHTRVTRLIQDETGKVIGVEALTLPADDHGEHDRLFRKVGPMPFSFDKAEKAIAVSRRLEHAKGSVVRLRARQAVVLATGGFCYNMDMLKEHMPDYALFGSAMLRMGSMGCDGSGIQLGQSVGGKARKLDNNFYGRIISPPLAFLEGIVVGRHGRRFYNEDAYNAELGKAIVEEANGAAWLIMDRRIWYSLRRQLMPRGDGQFVQWYLPALANILFGGSKKARSLEHLAKKCGIDPHGLIQEVDAGRKTMAAGGGDPLGKAPAYYRALGDGPYHALNLSVWNKFILAPFLTLGGLAVEESSGLVCDSHGTTIAGLYAIGRAAIGICANRYMSGMSLSDGVFSARRAARHIAARTDG